MDVFLLAVVCPFVGSRCIFHMLSRLFQLAESVLFHILLLLLQKAVDVIFDMLSLLSFKEQWMLLSIGCHSTFNISSGWIFTYSCCCFTMQWMWFATCHHCCLSKNKGFTFQCVLKADLIHSGWIFACFDYCFTMQRMCFSKYCHCSLSKNNNCSFPCVFTAHLISSGWTSICCHCCFTMQWI